MIRLLTVAAWLTMMGVVAIPSVGFGEANDPKERDALARGSISEPAREAEALGPALWLAVVGRGGVANTRRHKSEREARRSRRGRRLHRRARTRAARVGASPGRLDVVRTADHPPTPAIRVRRARLPRGEHVHVHSARWT